MYQLIVEYAYASAADRDAHMKAAKKTDVEARVRAEEGNIRYEYLVGTDDDRTVVLLEQWETEDAQQAHTHGAPFQEVIRLKEQYVQSQTMRAYDCTER